MHGRHAGLDDKGVGMRSVLGTCGTMAGGTLLPLTDPHCPYTHSQEWIETTSQFIKTVDPNHMVAIGSEVLAARRSSTLSFVIVVQVPDASDPRDTLGMGSRGNLYPLAGILGSGQPQCAEQPQWWRYDV